MSIGPGSAEIRLFLNLPSKPSRSYMQTLLLRQVSQAGISNYIPQFTVGCNYVSLPEIPVSGNKVHICYHSLWSHKQSSIQLMYFLFVLYQSDQPFLLWPKKRDHEIRIWNLEIKNAKKQLQNNSSKLFRGETWQGVLDTKLSKRLYKWDSLNHADKHIFVIQYHICDLGSRSWKGHPVHLWTERNHQRRG